MGRRNAREATMKLLYQLELNKTFDDEIVSIFFENNNFTEDEKVYIENTIENIQDNLSLIDEKIEKYIKGWKKERLSKIDLSILRISIFEIIFREDIPTEVSINESIEISKKYSSDESSKFINGVLGSFVRKENE
ncbi:transcription antitermination factor NusB [Senegalia massiliensis]|uniref:Transcription antitermination protein NusB n=1 Tax=Senegalia massiliensis TaxID=1720316 RepID=A0A845QYQ6_9CLOT|nr:transcription antitermination factor NusB [Senegalia massiliensis]NBI06646.1 transcription antitermination factor NusB [Senegalia massiliensis]